MKHLPPTIAGRGVLLLNAALILLALPHVTRAQAPAPTPAALIKNIVVNNQERTEAGKDQAVVTRAGGGETVAAVAGLPLYRGDVVETFVNTKVTLLFLDAPVAERDNEVIVDAGARVGISSTESWWGRIWAKVKGAFDSRTDYVRLAAVGTEYEFNVFKGEERATLVVLEGKVEFGKGTFTLAGQVTGLAPRSPGPEDRASSALFDAFVQNISWQEQFGRVLEVPAGRVTSLEFTYHISNECRQTHHFEFHTSENSEWLRLAAQNNAAVAPGATPINATLNVDATRLPPGQYKARVYATCVDCNLEPACTERQLEWPLIVTVKTGLTPTPTPTPTGTPTPQIAGELEEVTLTKGVDRPRPAATPRVLSVLDWTNNVILTAQPTYSAQNIIPHFTTVEDRSQKFRDARRRAVLGREPGANKTLGDVYNDWGQGAQAVRAYEKESSAAQQSPALEVDRAEAYRQTGQLNKAQDTLAPVLSSAPGFAPALNAEGNLNLDRARIELDGGNSTQAGASLEQARESYESALRGTQATTGIQGRQVAGSPTVRTNLGEAHVAAGDLAVRDRNTQMAGRQYQAAVDNLEPIQQADSQYPFPVTDLGRAYQGLGDVAKLEGKDSEAAALYESARRQHERAIGAHPDFAEAYFNLGDLYDDLGNKEAAKENYERAIKARPEQPAAYYPLAVLLQKENPRRAAELAATYLQLEPKVFRQGEKARNAERIVEGFDDVVPPVRPGQSVAATTPVPDVLNKTQAEAVSAVEAAGFIVRRVETRRVSNSAGRVIEQRPRAGTSARPGSAVDLVVSEAKLVEVPNVIDDKEETAKRKITRSGLAVGRVVQRASCKSVGKVLEQNPAQHRRYEPGTAVDLVIGSLGENPVTLPDFRRGSRDAAEAAIRDLGLNLRRVTTEQTEQQPPGTVIKQSPRPDSQYARGCNVNVDLVVAVPVVYVEVGDYVNMPLNEASRSLSENKLYASVSFQESPNSAPGIVVSQDLPKGSRVRQGTTVRLVVTAPPTVPKVTVPPVVGMKLDEAKRQLENLGLTVVVTTKDYSDDSTGGQAKDDTILSQDIPPRKKVPVGTTIGLVVNRLVKLYE